MSAKRGCLGQFLSLLARPAPEGGATEAPPYRLKRSLLTDNERAFHAALAAAIDMLGEPLTPVPQAGLASFLAVAKGVSNWQSWRNRIDRKSVDFLLCDRAFRPVLAIEVDDRSHRDRSSRDEFVDRALSAAGLPLLRLPARQSYTPAALRDQIRAALGSPAPTDQAG